MVMNLPAYPLNDFEENPFAIQITQPPKIHSRHFIEANTKPVTIDHLRDDCVVPVFSKDNEVTISHQTFIDTILGAACRVFPREAIDMPDIVVSHIVKGRIPEAIHKPVSQLLESDKTIYYERMAFCFEIPTIYQDIAGCRLNLSIGGVRAYNHENLYARKGVEKFKIFIGFKNLVCCNMCVSTDAKNDLKEDTLICNEEILLVVESSVDSLFCLPFIPDHYDDCIWAFPSHPATYPEVSPIEKSIKALENELKIQLVEYRTFFNVLQSILVVIDAEGLPRGIILFVEKDQKDVIAQLGKEILGFLKKERFSPGIDIEAEIGKPIPDIMVINLVDGR